MKKRALIAAAVAGLAVSSHASAAVWQVATGSSSWNTPANWNPADVPDSAGEVAQFNGAATGSNPAQTGNRTATSDGTPTVGQLIFNNDLSTFTNTIAAGTATTFTFDAAGAGPAVIDVPAAVGTGNNTISAPMTLTDSVVANVNNTTASSGAGALNLTGTMTGPGGFTKTGAGVMTFGTGDKLYSGATIFDTNGGRTRISQAAALTNTSSMTVRSGAQIEMITAGTYDWGTGPLNLNGSGIAAFPGALRQTTGLAIAIPNTVDLQSTTVLHVQAAAGTGGSATPTGSLTLSGVVGGVGQLVFTANTSNIDQGSLILTNNNTWTGGALVQGGILRASGANADFGDGNIEVNDALASAAIARIQVDADVNNVAGVVNVIADSATLTLAGGGAGGVADENFANLLYAGTDNIGALVLGGVSQAPGVYGSGTHPEFFAGPGTVTVVPEPATLSLLAAGAAGLLMCRRRA